MIGEAKSRMNVSRNMEIIMVGGIEWCFKAVMTNTKILSRNIKCFN